MSGEKCHFSAPTKYSFVGIKKICYLAEPTNTYKVLNMIVLIRSYYGFSATNL